MPLHFIYKILFFVLINKTIIAWKQIHRTNRLLMNNKDKQCIISSKNNNKYCNSEADKFIKENILSIVFSPIIL